PQQSASSGQTADSPSQRSGTLLASVFQRNCLSRLECDRATGGTPYPRLSAGTCGGKITAGVFDGRGRRAAKGSYFAADGKPTGYNHGFDRRVYSEARGSCRKLRNWSDEKF